MKPSKINIISSARNKFFANRFRANLFNLEDLYLCDNLCSTVLSHPALYRLDWRHWLYDDRVFYNYIKNVASLRLPYVLLSESPLGYERPQQILLSAYEAKLYERTKLAYEVIKETSPETTIISPAIDILPEYISSHYLDYFLHNRQYFDVYSMHCCYDLSERNLAKLDAFLTSVLRVLVKPLWVTRWAVPSCDHMITNHHSTDYVKGSFLKAEQAAKKLVETYEVIEKITHKNSIWFYMLSPDLYPFVKPEDEWWLPPESLLYRPISLSGAWDFYHFLGIVDCEGNPKEPIINAVNKLIENA